MRLIKRFGLPDGPDQAQRRNLIRLRGSVPILDLKPGLIQDAVNRLRTRGAAITKECPEGRPLSAKTVRSIATLLYSCLADAVRMEHIPANPMAAGK